MNKFTANIIFYCKIFQFRLFILHRDIPKIKMKRQGSTIKIIKKQNN